MLRCLYAIRTFVRSFPIGAPIMALAMLFMAATLTISSYSATAQEPTASAVPSQRNAASPQNLPRPPRAQDDAEALSMPGVDLFETKCPSGRNTDNVKGCVQIKDQVKEEKCPQAWPVNCNAGKQGKTTNWGADGGIGCGGWKIERDLAENETGFSPKPGDTTSFCSTGTSLRLPNDYDTQGQPVGAMFKGTIMYSQAGRARDGTDYGGVVVIKLELDDGSPQCYLRYMFLDRRDLPSVGDDVYAGQRIGSIASRDMSRSRNWWQDNWPNLKPQVKIDIGCDEAVLNLPHFMPKEAFSGGPDVPTGCPLTKVRFPTRVLEYLVNTESGGNTRCDVNIRKDARGLTPVAKAQDDSEKDLPYNGNYITGVKPQGVIRHKSTPVFAVYSKRNTRADLWTPNEMRNGKSVVFRDHNNYYQATVLRCLNMELIFKGRDGNSISASEVRELLNHCTNQYILGRSMFAKVLEQKETFNYDYINARDPSLPYEKQLINAKRVPVRDANGEQVVKDGDKVWKFVQKKDLPDERNDPDDIDKSVKYNPYTDPIRGYLKKYLSKEEKKKYACAIDPEDRNFNCPDVRPKPEPATRNKLFEEMEDVITSVAYRDICQPLHTEPVKVDDYRVVDMIYKSWRELLMDWPLAYNEKHDLDENSKYKLEEQKRAGIEPMSLNEYAKYPYERINDPSNPFAPRHIYKETERERYSNDGVQCAATPVDIILGSYSDVRKNKKDPDFAKYENRRITYSEREAKFHMCTRCRIEINEKADACFADPYSFETPGGCEGFVEDPMGEACDPDKLDPELWEAIQMMSAKYKIKTELMLGILSIETSCGTGGEGPCHIGDGGNGFGYWQTDIQWVRGGNGGQGPNPVVLAPSYADQSKLVNVCDTMTQTEWTAQYLSKNAEDYDCKTAAIGGAYNGGPGAVSGCAPGYAASCIDPNTTDSYASKLVKLTGSEDGCGPSYGTESLESSTLLGNAEDVLSGMTGNAENTLGTFDPEYCPETYIKDMNPGSNPLITNIDGQKACPPYSYPVPDFPGGDMEGSAAAAEGIPYKDWYVNWGCHRGSEQLQFVSYSGRICDDMSGAGFNGSRWCTGTCSAKYIHAGVDLPYSVPMEALGAPIHASGAGKVIAGVCDKKGSENPSVCAKNGGRFSNLLIEIDHSGYCVNGEGKNCPSSQKYPPGSRTKYLHLGKDRMLVPVGEEVKRCQQIGTVGEEASEGIPHVHYETYYDKNTVTGQTRVAKSKEEASYWPFDSKQVAHTDPYDASCRGGRWNMTNPGGICEWALEVDTTDAQDLTPPAYYKDYGKSGRKTNSPEWADKIEFVDPTNPPNKIKKFKYYIKMPNPASPEMGDIFDRKRPGMVYEGVWRYCENLGVKEDIMGKIIGTKKDQEFCLEMSNKEIMKLQDLGLTGTPIPGCSEDEDEEEENPNSTTSDPVGDNIDVTVGLQETDVEALIGEKKNKKRCDKLKPEGVLSTSSGWMHPLQWGPVTDVFGSPRDYAGGHKGVDIGVPVGTPVFGTKSGKVMAIVPSGGCLNGDAVTVDHGDGTYGQYLHLSYLCTGVKVGAIIEQGQMFSKTGDAGTGPHLHFTIYTPEGEKSVTPYCGAESVPAFGQDPEEVIDFKSVENKTPPQASCADIVQGTTGTGFGGKQLCVDHPCTTNYEEADTTSQCAFPMKEGGCGPWGHFIQRFEEKTGGDCCFNITKPVTPMNILKIRPGFDKEVLVPWLEDMKKWKGRDNTEKRGNKWDVDVEEQWIDGAWQGKRTKGEGSSVRIKDKSPQFKDKARPQRDPVPVTKNNRGAPEGYTFYENFSNHRPYMRWWDTGTEVGVTHQNTVDASNDDGAMDAIVGVGIEQSNCGYGGWGKSNVMPFWDPKAKWGRSKEPPYNPEQPKRIRTPNQVKNIPDWPAINPIQRKMPRNNPNNDDVVEVEELDPNWMDVRRYYGNTAWTELKLYQARASNNQALRCLPRYEKSFKSGSSEEYANMLAGGDFNTAYHDLSALGEVNISWPLGWRGYASEVGENRKLFGYPRYLAYPATNKENELLTAPSTEEMRQQIIKMGRNQQDAGGQSNGALQRRGLDNAQPGDILIWDEDVIGKNQDGSLDRLPHVAFVKAVELNKTDPDAPSADDPNNPSNLGGIRMHVGQESKDGVKFVVVRDYDFGKYPDACGNTNWWGVGPERKLYQTLPEGLKKTMQKKQITNVDCGNPDLISCKETFWNDIIVYRPSDDLRVKIERDVR